MMQPLPLTSRSLIMCSLVCVAILCLISLGQGLKTLAGSPAFVGPRAGTVARRTWESELGPFSPGPPGDSNNEEHYDAELPVHDGDVSGLNAIATMAPEDSEKIPWPLPNPLGTAPLSAVASVLGWHDGGGVLSALSPSILTVPSVPIPSSGPEPNLFGSVMTILAGVPSVTPMVGNPGGNNGPLGGLLSALSQAAPSQILPTSPITMLPAVTTGGPGGGLLPGLSVLDGVASALNGILGSPDQGNGGGIGILGQLSANVLGPMTSIAPDPASVLADPATAVYNLQSQVSAVLGSMPSALAAGIQLANNVGNDLAGALNATDDLLDSAPDVAGGVADQVGSLLNAAPALATGLPAVAFSAVNQMESILSADPDAVNDFAGLLDNMKDSLSSAVASAAPEVSTLAAVIGSAVVDVLPSGLQPLVSGALSSFQANAAGLLCQVSDTVGGTALVFGVPCDQISVTAGPPSTVTAVAPPSVSASLTLVESLPFGPATPPSSPPSSAPQLASLLSSLSSSVLSAAATAAPAGSPPADPLADSALSGLSSLINQVSQLSLTAPASSSSQPTPGPVASPSASPTAAVAETTIYYVQTITALITSTETQTDFVTTCPSAFASYTSAPDGSPAGSGGSPGADGSDGCPCPGQGYTCDDCLGGWFCPPLQTPALPAPCGYGWPCYHCQDGWFCAPAPSTASAVVHMYSTPISNAAFATKIPATSGYQLVGCYQDDQDRALKGTQLLTVAGGMTNEVCIDFCQGQGFVLARTEDGSQCFCGNTLVGSNVMGDEGCNISCAGDPMNSTVCGGAWALSIWSLDGSIHQGQSSEELFSPLISGPTGMPMGPGPVVLSTLVPAAATYAAEFQADSIFASQTAAPSAMDADDRVAADDKINRSKDGDFSSSRLLAVVNDGSYTVSASPRFKRGRKVSRRRTHWS